MFMEYFQRFILLFFTLLCLLYIVESINIDVDLSLDRSNWIDPNDPLSGNGHTRLASSNLLADGENICDGHCEQFTEVFIFLFFKVILLKNGRKIVLECFN